MTQNPDSRLKKFISGLGVIGATIATAWGFGFGGYLAYRKLFINTGERLLSDVDNVSKRYKR